MQYIRTELTTTSATHELPSVSLHDAYAGRAAVSMLQYSFNGASLARLQRPEAAQPAFAPFKLAHIEHHLLCNQGSTVERCLGGCSEFSLENEVFKPIFLFQSVGILGAHRAKIPHNPLRPLPGALLYGPLGCLASLLLHLPRRCRALCMGPKTEIGCNIDGKTGMIDWDDGIGVPGA